MEKQPRPFEAIQKENLDRLYQRMDNSFADRKYRIPRQFGGIGDNGDGAPEGLQTTPPEIQSEHVLPPRGDIFPLATGQGDKISGAEFVTRKP